jgi:copper chaperone CopZ
MLIDMTLRDVEGVSLARTDHTSGETVVTYDDDLVSVDALVEAVRGVGYEASPK